MFMGFLLNILKKVELLCISLAQLTKLVTQVFMRRTRFPSGNYLVDF